MSNQKELASSSLVQTQGKIAKTTISDIAAAASRGTLGAIPVVGPIIAEVVTSIIPGQRTDRIQAFLEKLSEKVEAYEADFIADRMKTPESIDLLEDCFQGAARALTEERIEYLANLYATGITQEQADYETNKKMVSLLNQLSDAEVIWLAYLAQRRGLGDSVDDKHASILNPRRSFIGASADELDAATVQEAWKARLLQLGLADHQLQLNARDRTPELDSQTGDWKRASAKATWLGRMLLNYIGIDDPVRTKHKLDKRV